MYIVSRKKGSCRESLFSLNLSLLDLIMVRQLILSHKSVEKIVWCYHLNETSLSELSQSPRGATQQSFAWLGSPPPPPLQTKKIPLRTLLTEEEPHLYPFLIPQTSFCRETTGGVTCEMSAVFSCYSFRRLTGVCLVLFFSGVWQTTSTMSFRVSTEAIMGI